MPENGFDFSGFRSLPVEREFLPREGMKAGQGVKLMLNLDLLSLEKMEQLEAAFNEGIEQAAGLFKSPVPPPPAKSDKLAVAGKKPLPKMKKAELLAKAKFLGLTISADAKIDEIAAEIQLAETVTFNYPKLELFAFEKARFKFFARALAGGPGETDPYDRLIYSWDVTKDGKPVPISYESFLQMPPHGLKKLYQFVIGEANNPTAQEKKPSETT